MIEPRSIRPRESGGSVARQRRRRQGGGGQVNNLPLKTIGRVPSGKLVEKSTACKLSQSAVSLRGRKRTRLIEIGGAEMRDERRQALAKVLVKVAANIEKLQQRRSHIGEQDTKTILINPILGALGWDLQSIDDVSQEYRHKPKDNPVDYALFFLRQPCLFVEAKALVVSA